MYEAAQRFGLKALVPTTGTGAKSVMIRARKDGDVYFRVRGHLRRTDDDKTFMATATVSGAPTCTSPIVQNGPSTAAASLAPATYHTLVLTYLSRLGLSDDPADPATAAFVKRFTDPVTGVAHRFASHLRLGEWPR